mmetsp:Transcript_51648/g.103695  ORF Transcript_51648/g.103695 Transcript_51648/m.103695 type:complete len:349 (+) Transcript_51648:132-1178(+)|eukprot:CAMPEP_0171594450 /NCGR_PEP_ID=MMETSP0990-20121206/693_1 /TAXON_ID=483369 /ORGANISM="non described non described, Strain CCMP2098" /LENGTH=348 /DNA_ID=CAMNT_0012155135 /DNA_START=246 /DNA_END=1292 /DNA_ORIENTATION=-
MKKKTPLAILHAAYRGVTMPKMTSTADSSENGAKSLSWLLRFTTVLRAISLPGTFIVFLLYWGLVYEGGVFRAISVMTHGVNFGVMFLETILNRQKFVLLHGLYFLSYTVLYLTWSVIFHVSGLDRPCTCSDDDDEQSAWGCHDRGDKKNEDECTFIYSSLNWASNALTTTIIVVLVIVLVVVPVSFVSFYIFALCLRRHCTVEDDAAAEPLSPRSLERQGTTDVLGASGYCATLKKEFQLSRLKPDVEDWVNIFRSSRFPSLVSDSAYLWIRGSFFVCMLAVMIWSISLFDDAIWLIYLTHWTLVVEVAYLGAAFTTTFIAQKEHGRVSVAEGVMANPPCVEVSLDL